MRGLACGLLLGCGAAAPPAPVANRAYPTRAIPTFEIQCDGMYCQKPGLTTVAWIDLHKLAVTIESPPLARDETYYFAARGPGNVVTVEGAKLLLTVVVPDPRPPKLTLDVQCGTCIGGVDRCPIPHIGPATVVIRFDRN
jgi:hypothetical protein